jgi:ABC-type transport system involved in cytochrome c biogenesis permease subunit
MIATIGFAFIGLAAIIQIVWLVSKKESPDPVSHWALLIAAILLFTTTIYRSIQIDFVAVTNTYESLIFFSGSIVLLQFIYRMQKRIRYLQFIGFGATVIALALLAISSSPIAPSDIVRPIPALQSYWLVLHVTMSFIGEAFFTVAFVASIVYLTAKDDERKKNVDRIIYTTIGIGYPIFTAGALVFGAIWAKSAWGGYWSWDPKETWALITWLTYTAYLHTRLVRKLRGKLSAIISIVGYLFTLFTFFGVNYLLSGLHSYG